MREITSHKVNGCNDNLQITVEDAPGNGGANHEYAVRFLCPPSSSLKGEEPGLTADVHTHSISFQNGPIKEVGTNGITHEALLAIVIDRLQCFQKGEFSCRENALALTHLEEAVHWLQHRTLQRLARGVEGTHAK